MNRGLLTIALLLLTAVEGRAQVLGQPPPSTPTFSPYLNLLRRGNPAVNYYGLVRPEQQWRNAVGQLQQNVQGLDTAVAEGQAAGTLTTGHATQFQNLSHFFPQSRQSGPGLGRPSGGAVTPAPAVNRPPQPVPILPRR